MKKVKVWIATLSLLLVLTTMNVPTQAMGDPGDQGVTQPQADPIPWEIILLLILLGRLP